MNLKPLKPDSWLPCALVCRVWQLHTGEFNRVFKKDNREQKIKKILLAHRSSRQKVPYSADWCACTVVKLSFHFVVLPCTRRTLLVATQQKVVPIPCKKGKPRKLDKEVGNKRNFQILLGDQVLT